MKKAIKTEKLSGRIVAFRIGLVLLLVIIAILMIYIGRGHTVYLDNKTVEADGTEYKSCESIVIHQKGGDDIKLAKRERGALKIMSGTLTLSAEVKQSKNSDVETKTIKVRLPREYDNIMISLPAYFAGLPEDKYLSEFIIQEEVEDSEGEPGTTDETMPGGDDFGADTGM